MSQRRRVAYYYDDDVGNYNYGYGHPMKPFRMRMAHNLVLSYGLDKKMTMMRPTRATAKEMSKFHSDDYIEYLERVTPEFAEKMPMHTARYLPGDDCPPFDGLFEFCSISAGGSIEGAKRLNHGDSDIVINWSGGLHHAKKGEASGFCYVNDIILAILELLRYHQRVLYLDIDVHHGDGVEEAFYTTDRVMSVSFHKYGDFFPGTGHIRDVGIGKGKYYAVNVPLRDGIDDESYKSIFQPVMRKVMESYRPGAVVMQCGTDSLSGDRLGCFNLSMKGHAACVEFMKSFDVPLFCVGGGGYTIRNVARTWAYETSVLLNEKVSPVLPYNDYYEFYGPEYRLDVPSSNMENANSREYLDSLISEIYEHLRHVPHAPSVQMHQVPRDWVTDDSEDDEDEDEHADTRHSQRRAEKRVANDAEYSDSDGEGESQRNRKNFRRSAPNRRIQRLTTTATPPVSMTNDEEQASSAQSASYNRREQTTQSRRSGRTGRATKDRGHSENANAISQEKEMEIEEPREEGASRASSSSSSSSPSSQPPSQAQKQQRQEAGDTTTASATSKASPNSKGDASTAPQQQFETLKSEEQDTEQMQIEESAPQPRDLYSLTASDESTSLPTEDNPNTTAESASAFATTTLIYPSQTSHQVLMPNPLPHAIEPSSTVAEAPASPTKTHGPSPDL